MVTRSALLLMLMTAAVAAAAQDSGGELATVKERELERVRERISDLKQSMDRSATERDRLTGELQAILAGGCTRVHVCSFNDVLKTPEAARVFQKFFGKPGSAKAPKK